MKLKKGDTVRVITGKDKGAERVVEKVYSKSDKVLVSGVNTAARHQVAQRANEQSGIIDKDLPIHVSNVMFVHKGDTVRLGYSLNNKGEKVRIARPSGDEV